MVHVHETARCRFAATRSTRAHVMMMMMIIMSHGVTHLRYISSSQLALHRRCAISPSNQDDVGVGVKSSDQREERDSRQTDGDINKSKKRNKKKRKS